MQSNRDTFILQHQKSSVSTTTSLSLPISVSAKYSEERHNLTLEEAQAITTELHNIQKSLSVGEQEKVELMKSLACLKEDLTRLQYSESSLDVSASANEKFSTASQTDLVGEVKKFAPISEFL